MKKVEIITLHYIDNYGSVLQSLATQEVFKKIGCDSEIIDLVRDNYSYEAQFTDARNDYSKRLKSATKVLLPILLNRWKRQYFIRSKVFTDFRNKYFHMTRRYINSDDLKNNPPIGDYYCTGSDQVWNTNYNGGILDEYFLSFVPKGKKKIALSSSFGTSTQPPENAKIIGELLSDYDFISVREQSALAFLNRLGIKGAIHVIDPTLAITMDEWSNILKLSPVREKKYVLIYQLNNNSHMIKFAKNLANQKKIDLVMITKSFKARLYSNKVYFCPTVEQFLSLIKYADYIVTDSFHGTAFSINFNKLFFVFNPPKYSTRIESVLKMTGTYNRLLESDYYDDSKDLPINYDDVNNILNFERKKIMKFAQSILY